MKSPEHDLDDRLPIWDAMQDFWMDTDPAILLPGIIEVCRRSKYTLGELEAIYWNEVRPAVSFNLWMLPAPEWAGFDSTFLTERVLAKHRYGRRLSIKWLHPYADKWWQKLRAGIEQARAAENAR